MVRVHNKNNMCQVRVLRCHGKRTHRVHKLTLTHTIHACTLFTRYGIETVFSSVMRRPVFPVLDGHSKRSMLRNLSFMNLSPRKNKKIRGKKPAGTK